MTYSLKWIFCSILVCGWVIMQKVQGSILGKWRMLILSNRLPTGCHLVSSDWATWHSTIGPFRMPLHRLYTDLYFHIGLPPCSPLAYGRSHLPCQCWLCCNMASYGPHTCSTFCYLCQTSNEYNFLVHILFCEPKKIWESAQWELHDGACFMSF